MVFKIILIIIAFVMLCGMVADESRYNKRTYCIGFVACIIARAILEWFHIVQHRGQAKYYKENNLDMLLLGRRRAD